MPSSFPPFGLVCLFGLVCFAGSAHAFGAGNIGSTSRIEGQNWRHGDIEDALLTILMARAAGGKKFSKLDVKRVYFGNWLRDYSQAVDTGTLKYCSAEAIRLLLWILGFMTFGYATKEFEVTTARLGCYRPEEHIDNPKNYNDNNDARQYDRRLRGPVDERRELSVDPDTGLKNYIANERIGIDTSAGLVRKVFGCSIQLGRQYARSKNKADLYEALRLLGTGCHCLEDFSAHSNYTELALLEMGERDIFPHVGRRSQVQLRGSNNPLYPCVTGTFGPTDFLHSVMGEFSDKATQSEIQNLEQTMNQAQNSNADTSMLQDLLNQIPEGIFGGENEAQKADDLKTNAQAHQMQNTRISPRDPEAWVNYIDDVQQQIRPILEWHDEVMKGITETIDAIPILPDLIEQLQEQVNIFVFSLLAPYVIPIITQVKRELNTGSSEIIESSEAEQHVVFRDDHSTDPTHSMLSKDHFSNVLNEPAGKIGHAVVKWVVPQLMACWDDEGIDVDRTLTRIVSGVLHHPALRDYGQDGASDGRRLMFGVVEKWWREQSSREQDGLRQQLSRQGVEDGRNHKPGVVDHGHGGAKPLGMPKLAGGGSSSGIEGAVMGGLSEAFGGGSKPSKSSGGDSFGKSAGEAVGGGLLGSVVGGLAGGLLGGAFGEDEKKSTKSEHHGRDGSYNQTYTEYGQSGSTYGQAQYSQTDRQGEREEQYTRYEQQPAQSGGYGGQQYSQTSRYDQSGQQTYHHEERISYGEEQRYRSGGGGGGGGRGYGEHQSGGYPSQSGYNAPHSKSKSKSKSSDDDSDNDDPYKRQQKREKKARKEREKQQKKQYKKQYGKQDSDDDDSNDSDQKKKHRSEYSSQPRRERRDSNDNDDNRRQQYGQQSSGYGQSQSGGYGESRSGGYGESNRGGYGGDRGDNDGGYSSRRGGDDDDRGYGGRRDDDNERGGYGGRRDEDEGGYGQSGGGGYGQRRDEDDGERRRYDY